MSGYTFKEAKRRYKALFWPASAIYAVVCIGGAIVQRMAENPPVWLAPVLAVVTIAPVFAMMFVMWRYSQETDEFSRVRQLEAFSIAGMITACAAGLVGFLQIYDVIKDIEVFWFLPLYFLSYGITHQIRGGRDCV